MVRPQKFIKICIIITCTKQESRNNLLIKQLALRSTACWMSSSFTILFGAVTSHLSVRERIQLDQCFPQWDSKRQAQSLQLSADSKLLRCENQQANQPFLLSLLQKKHLSHTNNYSSTRSLQCEYSSTRSLSLERSARILDMIHRWVRQNDVLVAPRQAGLTAKQLRSWLNTKNVDGNPFFH